MKPFVVIVAMASLVAFGADSMRVGSLRIGTLSAKPPPAVMSFLVTGQSLGRGYLSGGYTAFDESTASTFTNNWMPYTIGFWWISGLDQAHSRRERDLIHETANVVSGWKAFSDQLAALHSSNSVAYNGSLVFDYAQSGSPYSELCRTSTVMETVNGVTTNKYWWGVNDFTNQFNYQQTQPIPNLTMGAILCVHGEGDLSSTTYGTNLLEWQTDYSSNIGAYTGQRSIPFFSSQPASFNPDVSGNQWKSATNMLWVHELSSGQSNVLVMAKYHLNPYVDGVHLTNSAYDWMGEYYAKAVFKKVALGQRYDPLYPTNIARVGAVITLTYTGGTWPLVLDTTNVTDPGDYGFSYTDDSGSPPSISSVALSGADTNQVTITLSSTPTGSKSVRYACFNGTSGYGHAGPTTGPRGCLRDSDPTLGYTTRSNLWNWGVVFIKDVP